MFLKDYNMSVHYHTGKENEVADALSRLSMGSVAHVEKQRKEIVKDVHRLARLGVRLMSISDSGVTVQNGVKSSFVVEVRKSKIVIQFCLNLRCSPQSESGGFLPRGRWCSSLQG